ncbi:hypothetical protein PpBr36_00657 [Pyricularia pennisetigena]|uniref:hypothetical protein n=1 Tax=Pyricularia pennisetigena TaxID=1578925 RepID=UPI00115383FE|nr:hypothetical protein PpBr36_00657 [Pyricularia pennisetigena]TLS28495.1 hypothetical protein PpBr36_00657 [Pyricularia pennisetigena]
MPGFLVPPWYHDDGPSDASVRLALLTIGFFTAVTCFTLVKLIYQTYWFWVRSLKPNEYLVMVQLSVNILIHILKFLIPCPRRAARIKWTVVGTQMLMLISIYIVWIPAQLQVNNTFLTLDGIWVKIISFECLFVNGMLGGYLALLAKRRRDTAKGLNYWSDCFWKILALVSIMTLMDVMNVVALSLPDRYFYILFQPTMYMVKVFTEMTISEVLCKILYPSDSSAAAYGICEDLDMNVAWDDPEHGGSSFGSDPSPSFNGMTLGGSSGGQQPLPPNWTPDMNWWPWTTFRTTVTSDHTHAENQPWTGIQKTVETDVRHEWVVLHHREREGRDVKAHPPVVRMLLSVWPGVSPTKEMEYIGGRRDRVGQG